MGVVYLARDVQLHNRPVVIKVLRDVMEEDWHTKKFKQEIEALVRLEHPGIVGVFDSGEMPDGQLFVVLQFVEGVNLRSIIKSYNGPMEFERVAQIMEQAGRALSAAHDKGVLHCDVKPENIMIQQLQPGEEIVKLIDFGIAKIRDSQVTSAAPTRVAGTISYMAPEQLEGAPTAASDIFALGAIAYELLTGKRAFPAQNFVQILHMHHAGVTEKPKEILPDLPDAAQAAILKALAFDPADRYAKAREFTDDLARALRGTAPQPAFKTAPTVLDPPRATKTKLIDVLPEPHSVPPIQPPLQTTPAPRNNAQIVALVAVLVLGIIAGIVWWTRQQPSAAKEQTATTAAPPVAAPKKAVPAAPELVMNYSILVQKYRDGKKFEEPFRPTRDINFEPDYHIQIHLTVPKTGHLYILNEGPKSPNGLPEFNAMFPIKADSQIEGNKDFTLPRSGWFVFDKERGTEKVWLVYSPIPVPELAFMEKLQNPEIKDFQTIQNTLVFLSNKQIAETERKDELTILKARSDVLVHLLKLDHF
jgi:hypothetical protein